MKNPLRIALLFALAQVLLHLATAANLGFHRDEFLYLALGRHLDWGYWSNGPFIGLVGWFSQTFFGDSLFATRFLPALAGGLTIWLVGLMVRELGGGRWAQAVSGVAMLVSAVWLRAFGMLQPVPFDILCWTALSFLLLKILKGNALQDWVWLGVVAGLGLLNKYTLVFWAMAFFLALLVTPQRRRLLTRGPWVSAGVALLLFAPNLWWQWQHDFPVAQHMRELAESQLSHVEPLSFLLDQVLFHGGGLLVWLPGLVWLLRSHRPTPRPGPSAGSRPVAGDESTDFRLLGWFYLAVVFIFLVFKGKNYYTIGAYPVLFAAGGVFWEKITTRRWLKMAVMAAVVMLALPLAPLGIPGWKAERLAAYFQWLGLEPALRWEDGEIHPLPQDYADMLGWPELAGLVDIAFERAGDPENLLLYAENYGQAGAVEHLSRQLKVLHKPIISFSDSYRLWAPRTLPPNINTLIYINDELGADVQALFADIQQVGEVTESLARERGTAVWVCRAPREDFPAWWAARVKDEFRFQD